MKNILLVLAITIAGIACKSKVSNNETGNIVKTVNVEEAKKMISTVDNLTIIDVRTPEETADGMIQGAIGIDYKNSNFDTEIAKLDKALPYLIYCRSGKRSTRASNIMVKAGFTNITNMKGGYLAWTDN